LIKQLPAVKDKDVVEPAPAIKGPGKRRIWRRIGIGLAVFVLINLLVVLLEPYFLYIASFKLLHATDKILLYQQGARPDIVFMGSSRVENGLDPAVVEQAIAEKTGIKPRALNLGMPNNDLQLNYLLLKNIIQDDKKPAVIVYGLSELELDNPVQNQNYFQSLIKNIPDVEVLFRPDDVGRYGGSKPEQQAAFMFNQFVPIFRDQKLILTALNIQFNSQNIYHSNYENRIDIPSNGYLPNNTTFDPAKVETNAEIYKSRLPEFQVQNTDLAFLQDFLKLAKQRDIKVVLVNMPVSAQFRNNWQSNDRIKHYTDTIQNLARENEVPLLDAYQNPDGYFTQKTFYDSNHLNPQGATLLSQMVGRDYLARYFMPADSITKEFFNAKLSDLNLPARLPSNLYTTGTVSFANLSQSYWPVFGDKKIRLAYHWLNSDGTMNLFEGDRTDFNYSPVPGKTQNIPFTIRTPLKPGQYILQVDLVYEFVKWFGDMGNTTLKQTVTIQP
jgi:hypothetical protein